MEKLKIFLGERKYISLKTIRDFFNQKMVKLFLEKSDELGYYRCGECDYYIHSPHYDFSCDLCKDCKKQIIERSEEIEKDSNSV